MPNHAVALIVYRAPEAVTTADPLVDNQPGVEAATAAVGATTAPDASSTTAARIAATRVTARRTTRRWIDRPDIGTPAVIVAARATPSDRDRTPRRAGEHRKERFPRCYASVNVEIIIDSRARALIPSPIMAPPTDRGSVLDHVSKAIVEQLQEDGRRSYAEIGKAVGLSETATRQRVQKLQDAGILQIVAVTDPLQLGFARQAMIGVRVSGDTRVVAAAMTELPGVTYVVSTAGSFDLLVEVVCESDDDLIDLLNDRIRSLPDVVSTETFVYLKLHRQLYNWGTR